MKQISSFMLLISLFFCSSCSLFSSSEPVKHYYQIYYAPKMSETPPIQATVRIKTFEVDKIYRRNNLVYRTSFEEMFYYNAHLWASRPADMITDLVVNHIAKKRAFSDVILTMDKRPDYVLSGRVVALDEIDSEEKWFARVAIIFELKSYKTDETVVSYSFETRKEVKIKKPVYVVRAMGEIIENELEIFLLKISDALLQDSSADNSPS